KLAPDIPAQAVAAGDAQRVLQLLRLRRARQQVTAQFADVLEQRAALGDHVLPEPARPEALTQYHRASPDQCRAGRDNATDAVIQRQAVVHAVTRLHVDQSREPVAPLHEAEVTDISRLREAGGSGGVDAQRPICERGCTHFAIAQSVTGQISDRLIEPWKVPAPGPPHPPFDIP